MIQGALLFISAFIAVFLFGFQGQIVRDKHMITAFFVSLAIGATQSLFFKYVPEATFWQTVAWVVGGAFGIVASMYAHDVWLKYFPNGKVMSKNNCVNLYPKPTEENTITLYSDNRGKISKHSIW